MSFIFILLLIFVILAIMKLNPELDYDEKNRHLFLQYNACGRYEKCRKRIRIL
jgi:hypothetical protein